MRPKVDFLIVGSGIIGLSIALELQKKFPSESILIAEKEFEAGAHASGRNSGVLHAGFYYSPDSLKAKFCLDGNRELKKLISDYKLPINNCGKVVVAQNEYDIPRMHALYEKGIVNGVPLYKFPSTMLSQYEPLAQSYKEFLWSPETSVSDPALVLDLLKKLFLERGGQIQFGAEVEIKDQEEIYLSGNRVEAENVINVSGTYAIHLAHQVGAAQNYSQLPVLGMYKITKAESLPLRTLVYPVPNPRNPFLGVHFTLTVDGDVKIGPTAIPIVGREQYGLNDFPDKLDYKSSMMSLSKLFKSSPIELLNLAISEMPKLSTRKLVSAGRNLVPSITPDIDWKRKRPGIRAQLVNYQTNSFEMDFVVEKKDKYIHILNAVSPGWTSAIPFARYIVEKYVK